MRVSQRGVDGCGQVDAEGLGAFDQGVVDDAVADRLYRLAWGEDDDATTAVGVVKVDRAGVGVRQREADLVRARCTQAKDDVDVADVFVGVHRFAGDLRRADVGGVVGHDARRGAALRQARADRCTQGQGEGFVAFVGGVVDQRDVDRGRRLSGQQADHTRARHVVGAGQRRAVGGGVVEVERLGGRNVQREHKARDARLLVDHDVLQRGRRQRRRRAVIAGNDHRRKGRADDGIHRRVELHHEELGAFVRRVVVNAKAHRLGCLTRREDQCAVGQGVVIVKVVVAVIAVVVLDADLLGTGRAQAHNHRGIARDLVDHRRLDGDDRVGHVGAVIGHDARIGRGVADEQATWGVEHQAEVLVSLGHAVVVDRHRNAARGLARRKTYRATGGDVVATGRGAAVGGGELDRNVDVGRLAQGQDKGRCAGLFVHRNA